MKSNKTLLRVIVYSIVLLTALFVLRTKHIRGKAEKLYQEGYAAEQSHQFDQAIALFTRAIELDPKHYVAYKARGNAYQGKEQFDHAIEQYQLSLKINPNHASTYYNQGIAYYRKAQIGKDQAADYAKAVASYSRAIELKPTYYAAYLNRGVIYTETNRVDDAIVDYSQAITIKPFYKDAYLNRGAAYLQKGEADLAIEDFQWALERNPNPKTLYRIYIGLVMAALIKGDLETAQDIVDTKMKSLNEPLTNQLIDGLLTPTDLEKLKQVSESIDKEFEKKIDPADQ